jgi:hypothetical protein
MPALVLRLGVACNFNTNLKRQLIISMKKSFLLIFSGFIIMILCIIIESCCNISDYKFEWKNMSLRYLEKTINQDDRIYGNETTSDEFIFDRFGLRLMLDGDIIANNFIGFSLIQNVNAQVDCFNNYSPKYKIDNIQVETLSDFDESKLQNSDISNYFKASLYNGILVSIEDYLNDNNEINGDGNSESFLIQSIDLFLTEPPKKDSLFRFVIKIHFENDTTFCDTTKTVKITK